MIRNNGYEDSSIVNFIDEQHNLDMGRVLSIEYYSDTKRFFFVEKCDENYYESLDAEAFQVFIDQCQACLDYHTKKEISNDNN